MASNKAFNIVSEIIENLEDRKGFEYFWDEIRSDDQKEILNELAEIVDPYLRTDPNL